MQSQAIVFSDANVSRRALITAARSFAKVPYSRHRNYIVRGEGGAPDLKRSSLNCYGFLLAVARECALLPADFDLSRARWRAGQTLDAALWELLKTNFVRVKKSNARPGDVFLMRFTDVDESLTGPHHVAIKTSSAPRWPRRGRMMHAIERDATMQGAVIEQEIDALEWRRVHSVWRLQAIHRADLKRALYRA